MSFETGTCGYVIKWKAFTYTSGNELRGPEVLFGEYADEMDAKQALADDGFTNGEFGWRKGYSDASIRRVVEYEEV